MKPPLGRISLSAFLAQPPAPSVVPRATRLPGRNRPSNRVRLARATPQTPTMSYQDVDAPTGPVDSGELGGGGGDGGYPPSYDAGASGGGYGSSEDEGFQATAPQNILRCVFFLPSERAPFPR